MRILTGLFFFLWSAGAALAYCPEEITRDTRTDQLIECVRTHKHDWEKTIAALNAYRTIGADPASILEHVNIEELRSKSDIAEVIKNQYDALWSLFTPERYREGSVDSFLFLRSRFSNEPALRGIYTLAKETALRLVNRAAVAGALVNAGDRLDTILAHPADALLAQKGMQWLYSLHCTKEDYRDRDACRSSSFPAEFRAVYGKEPTHENVWILGFLVRRDLERRGLSVTYQELARDLLGALGWKPKS